ncbi:uncharacterized protein ATNIH1004_003785 [Aspergillus tanneri]|uniref:Rhodopsin domain-containing protein n=1 Tax=Aspergillus tanneri TaxID=1220188 RepID=A0A5M9MVD1_9EURO|nr:uncharacterized protein ATNIH1004_003785 [Aspergillus tanneri]KAA8651092.1 hypothetical protein ATNIH1004_003785 [Aspergillus tanneri]
MPAMALPRSNLEGANRSWVIDAVSWPFFGVSLILCVLRLYARARIIRSLGWDDAFLVLAMICAAMNSSLATVSAHYGTGRHMVDLADHQRLMATKYNWLSQGFHVMSTNWGKVSVAMFLLRIIRKVKHHKPAMVAGMLLLTIVNTVCVYTIYGQFLNMESDISSAMIAAIIKSINLASLSKRNDYSWNTVDLTIWIAIEQYLIIIAACIPAITPLFNITVARRSTHRNAGSSQKGYSSRQYMRNHGYAQFGSRNKEVSYMLDNYPGATKRATTEHETGDGSSEDRFIPGDPGPLPPPGQGIVKTTEIHVQGVDLDETDRPR